MNKKTNHMPQLPPLPYHLHIDKAPNNERAKSGSISHQNTPRFVCRFLIGDVPKETKGLTVHNAETGVTLYNLILSDTTDLKNDLRNVESAMKEGARVIYDTINPPFFRK
ncbi:hypothetical protein [Aquimarina sp. RZ0]|uniref:hypothetical protein n=1 Tax=Aquimarina sp. RZ0 TaxID=2607730 RepID=UPI0011F09F31|nr:hypothetical protein [Aquimarina sp. RZ0]KAA1244459.1 hypothetical protein F0000_16570 [Aquimarina sp. RZ0]